MSPRAWSALRWAIGAAVVAVLVVTLDPAQLAASLSHADLRVAVLGIAALTAVHLIAAETWRLLCRRLVHTRLDWTDAVRRYFVAQALGGLTPANLGGDLYRVQAMRSISGSYAAATAPVAVQRATSYGALSGLAVIAVVFLVIGREINAALAIPALVVAALTLASSAVLIGGWRWARRGRAALMRRFLSEAAADLDHERDRLPSAILIGLGLGALFHAASIAATALLLASVDGGAVTPAAIAALAVARLAIAIPISPSGLGFQEGALSALFVGIGLSPATALAALLLARVSLLTTAIAGAVALGAGGSIHRRAASPSAESVSR